MISFVAKGLSMDPLIREGDSVLVSPIKHGEIRLGDILAFSSCQVPPITAHRLVAIKRIQEKTRYILQGDFTSDSSDVVVAEDIVGRVAGLERQGKIIYLDNFYCRFLKWLWNICPALGGIILLFLRSQTLYFKIQLLVSPRFFIKPPKVSLEAIRGKFNQQEEVNFYLGCLEQGLEDWEEEVVKKIMVNPHAAILNVGCGAGREAFALAKQGFRVTAIDIAPAMIAAAKKKAQAHGLDVRFEIIAASEIAFPAHSFDYCIVGRFVYSFIPSKPMRIESLRKIKQCLKPGGGVFLSAYVIPTPFLSGRWCVDTVRRIRNILLPFMFASEPGDMWTRGVSSQSRFDTFCFCHYFNSQEEVVKEIKQAGLKLRESKIENILLAEA